MTTTTQFPHKIFLEENRVFLENHPLPAMLHKRILGFEELEEDLQHLTDEDRVKFIDQLEILSNELDEDLEEYFEEDLENNDHEEDEPEEPILPEQSVEPEFEPIPMAEPIPEIVEVIEPAEELAEATPEPEQILEPEAPKELSDEEILIELVENQQLKVSPFLLMKRGFKTELRNKQIVIGKYILQRGRYDTFYTILLKD